MQRLFNQPFTQNRLPNLKGTSLADIHRFIREVDQIDIAFYATKGIFLVPNYITYATAVSLEDALHDDDLPENHADQFKLIYTRSANLSDLAWDRERRQKDEKAIEFLKAYVEPDTTSEARAKLLQLRVDVNAIKQRSSRSTASSPSSRTAAKRSPSM